MDALSVGLGRTSFALHATIVIGVDLATQKKSAKIDPERLRKASIDYFLSMIEEDKNGCWIWKGPTRGGEDGRRGGPYGKMTINGVQIGTHRVSVMIFHGVNPAGRVVLHKCDVTLCCNPDHLKPGTQRQNVRDMIKKGRGKPFGREYNPKSRGTGSKGLTRKAPNVV